MCTIKETGEFRVMFHDKKPRELYKISPELSYSEVAVQKENLENTLSKFITRGYEVVNIYQKIILK